MAGIVDEECKGCLCLCDDDTCGCDVELLASNMAVNGTCYKEEMPKRADKDAMLKRAADCLRGIRMKAERWDSYPDARDTLAELVEHGY